jgi:hypothetical protein
MSESNTASCNQTKDPTRTTNKIASSIIKSLPKRPMELSRRSSDRISASARTEGTDIEKFVSFANHASVVYTIARGNYSPKEIKATWYSTEENLNIGKQCSKQILKMDRGETLKDIKYCARGLEGHTRTGFTMKIQNRALSINSVLAEQHQVQLLEGFRDDEAIARVYHQAAASCQIWACVVGLRDQRVAENYLDEAFEVQVKQTSQECEPIAPCAGIQPCKKPLLHLSIRRPERKIISARTA